MWLLLLGWPGFTGCSRLHVIRTVNADGSVLDEYRAFFNQGDIKTPGFEAFQDLNLQHFLTSLLEHMGTSKVLAGELSGQLDGRLTYHALADHVTQVGVLFESPQFLAAHSPVWKKQADGGWTYEATIDLMSLKKVFCLASLLPQDEEAQPPGDPPAENPDEGPPPFPDPLQQLPVPPPPPHQTLADERLKRAWQTFELQVDVVLPGTIKSANTALVKDRTATWKVKPGEMMEDFKQPKPDGAGNVKDPLKSQSLLVLKATCGPALPVAKTDEERFKKFKKLQEPKP